MTERLYRSTTDRVIGGVAGGLAAWLRIDPSIVRVAWVVLAVVSGGIFLLVYVVMLFVVPLAPGAWTPSAGASVPGPPPPVGGPTGQWGPPGPGGQWTPPPAGGPGSGWRTPDAGNAGIVFGFILVGLGLWFLVDQFVHIDWQLVWPVVVILIGAALILGAMRRKRPQG